MLSSSSRASLQPLGKFLCPQCNNVQVISRLGITVLPPVKAHSKLPSSPVLHHARKANSPTFNTSSSPSSPLLSHSRNASSSSTSDQRCSFHLNVIDSYCYSCNIQLCRECVLETHMLHHIGQFKSSIIAIQVPS